MTNTEAIKDTLLTEEAAGEAVGGVNENLRHRVVCRSCHTTLRQGFLSTMDAFDYVNALNQKCRTCGAPLYVEAYSVCSL